MICACTICGAMAHDVEALDEHLVRDHMDASIDNLVTRAFKEAIEIYDLQKLFKKECY